MLALYVWERIIINLLHVPVQAVADYFGVRMMVVTSYPEGELIEITPRGPLLTKRALYLSFWAEVLLNTLLLCSPAHILFGSSVICEPGDLASSVHTVSLSVLLNELSVPSGLQVHYNSLFPKAEPPGALPHDKFLGSRRLYNLLH